MISGGWSGSRSASVLLWPVPSRRRDWLVYRDTGTLYVCVSGEGGSRCHLCLNITIGTS